MCQRGPLHSEVTPAPVLWQVRILEFNFIIRCFVNRVILFGKDAKPCCAYIFNLIAYFGDVCFSCIRKEWIPYVKTCLHKTNSSNVVLWTGINILFHNKLPLSEFYLFFKVNWGWTFAKKITGYPSLAITFFLHEAYGEERILKVLDFFQRPPWQYHHTESCGSRTGGIHITSSSSSANALLRPYLLPSRDFYSLGAGMPVWGVRPVHCGGEILRVTLYSGYDNYEDAVRFYETVLQRQAEEQKTGFCWFTLHTGRSSVFSLFTFKK